MVESISQRSDPAALIVGAGPSGLTLAIELARRGVPIRVIERLAQRPRTSRAIGTQQRTIEVFQLMGIPEAALQPAARPRALRLAERDRTLARVEINDPALDDPIALLSMDESDTEWILENRLRQLGGQIEWGVTLMSYRVDEGGVTATLRGAAGDEEARARFLIGADGAHSTVRELAGISFAGAAYAERFLLADLDIDWALSHDEGHVWVGDDGLAAVIPLPGERRYRVIMPLPAAESELADDSEAAIAAQVERLLRERSRLPLRRVGDPHWASHFRIQRRQADRYRAGPVFLVGDAAHVHSPVGGQGMNTGIQDAFNLGWKLALAVNGKAAPGLLDTYQQERHPIARGVLQGTNIATRLVLSQNRPLRAFREYGVPALTRFGPLRRRFLETLGQLTINYRGSFLAVNADAGGDAGEERRGLLPRAAAGLPAGDRVPDMSLRAADAPVALYDLVAQGWTMLLFPGDAAAPEAVAALDALAEWVRQTVGEAVRPFVVFTAPPATSRTAALIDPVGEAARRFGAGDGLVALVRPDGYLGYRGEPGQCGPLASYLARVFAMRVPDAGPHPSA